MPRTQPFFAMCLRLGKHEEKYRRGCWLFPRARRWRRAYTRGYRSTLGRITGDGAPIRYRPSATPVRCASRASGDDSPGVTLRRGVQSDADAIRAGVLRESMNPLGLDPTRFVVAVDDARGGEIVGSGQLKPWETLSDRPKDDVVGIGRLMNLTPNWSSGYWNWRVWW